MSLRTEVRETVQPAGLVVLVIATLLYSGANLNLHDFGWWLSFSLQWFFGYKIFSSLDVGTDSRSAFIGVGGAAVGIGLFSLIYQLLLALTAPPTVCWSGAHLALFALSRLSLRIKVGSWFFKANDDSALSASFSRVSLVIGGSLVVLGATELRELLLLGITLLFLGMSTSSSWNLRFERVSRNLKLLKHGIVLTGIALTGVAIRKTAHPFGWRWWITSNDLQYALTHAVSLSHNGMWDDLRMLGFKQTHHWSVTGWSGMNWPYGAFDRGVGLHLKFLLAGLLLMAVTSLALMMTRSKGLSADRVLPVSTLVLALFYRVGWDSQQTVFGHLTLILVIGVSFSSSNQNLLTHLKSVRLAIVCLIATWANAINLPLIALVIVTYWFVRLFDAKRSKVEKISDLMRYLVIMFSCVLAWYLLFIPSAKPRAFLLHPLMERDSYFARLSNQIPNGGFWNIITVFLMETSIQPYLLASFLILLSPAIWKRLDKGLALPLLGIGVFALGLPYFVSVGPDTELVKIRMLSSLVVVMLLVPVGVIFSGFDQPVSRRTYIRASTLSLIVLGSASMQFSVVNDQYFPVRTLSDNYLLRLLITVFTPLASAIALQMLKSKDTKNRLTLLLFVCIIGLGIGGSLGYHVREVAQRQQMAKTELQLQLNQLRLAPDEVLEVAEWLRTNTPSDAVIASNYFCDVGSDCPSSDLPASVTDSDLWRNGKSDQSNLVGYSQRQFLIQSPRHLWGYATLSDGASQLIQASLHYVSEYDNADELLSFGVSYFVVDFDSLSERHRSCWGRALFTNRRFAVYKLESSHLDTTITNCTAES